MDLFQALILSIIEGATEFLPISSTGHLILTTKILGITESNFVKSFEIIIQSGAILSVIVLYSKTILQNKNLIAKIAIAFLPTGVIGLLFYKTVKESLLGNDSITLISLIVGGIAIIGLELYFQRKEERKEIKDLTYKNALLIGLFQSMSIIPGVSRAAATIFGGFFAGLDRKGAVEFSFMLAIPTMLAATSLDLAKNVSLFSTSEIGILTFGFIASFIVALIVVKWLLSYVKSNTFIPFGIYRIVLAILFYIIFLR